LCSTRRLSKRVRLQPHRCRDGFRSGSTEIGARRLESAFVCIRDAIIPRAAQLRHCVANIGLEHPFIAADLAGR